MKSALLFALAYCGNAQTYETEPWTATSHQYSSSAKAFTRHTTSLYKGSLTKEDGTLVNYYKVMVSTGFDNYSVDGIETWGTRAASNDMTGWYTGIGFGYGDMIEGKPWILCEQLKDDTAAESAVQHMCFWNVWPDDAEDIGSDAVVPVSGYPAITVSSSTVTWQEDAMVTTTRGEKSVELAVSPTWTFSFEVNDDTDSDLYDAFDNLKGKKKESILAYGKVYGGSTRTYAAHPDKYDRSHGKTKWSGAVNTAVGLATLVAITSASLF